MISIQDNVGRVGLQTTATIMDIADDQYVQTSSAGSEYLPSTVEFEDKGGKSRLASCMLYIKQYPNAAIGDKITINAFPGDERGPVIMSALGGRIKNDENWFDFEKATVEQQTIPAD